MINTVPMATSQCQNVKWQLQLGAPSHTHTHTHTHIHFWMPGPQTYLSTRGAWRWDPSENGWWWWSDSLKTPSMTDISVLVVLKPQKALQSFTKRPAPITSLPLLTVPACIRKKKMTTRPQYLHAWHKEKMATSCMYDIRKRWPPDHSTCMYSEVYHKKLTVRTIVHLREFWTAILALLNGMRLFQHNLYSCHIYQLVCFTLSTTYQILKILFYLWRI